MWGGGEGAAYVSGPGEGDIMVATLLSLRFAVVGGRVTVWCRDLWILGDFGQFSVIFGQKLAVFGFFDKEDKVRFISEFFYAGLWLAEHCAKRFSGASEQIEGVNKTPQDF